MPLERHARTTVPEWLRDVMRSKPYWLPVLLGLFVAHRELKKRRAAD